MDDDEDSFEYELYLSRRYLENLKQRTAHFIALLDERLGRRNMPFHLRVEVEELERLCL